MRAPDSLRQYAVPGRPGQELVYAEVMDADGSVGWARFVFCDPIDRPSFRGQMLYPDHHVAVAALFRDDMSPLPPEVSSVDDVYRGSELEFLWSEMEAGIWSCEKSYRLRFVDGLQRDQVAERVFDEPYDQPHGPTPAQRESQLTLPRRRWLARMVEFTPAAILAYTSFLEGIQERGELNAILFFTVPVLFLGAALAAQGIVVRRGFLAVDGLFRRTVYRHFTAGGVDDSSNGAVQILLIGHGLVKLRWAGHGLEWRRSDRVHASALIDNAYGDDSYAAIPGWGVVERSWIRWRVITWMVLIAAVPLLSALGGAVF